MDKTVFILPESVTALGWVGLVLVMLGFWRSADWKKLLDPTRSNLFLGASVALLVLWQIRTGVRPGLEFHLFGVSAATLMFGPWRGMFAGLIAMTGSVLAGHGEWTNLGIESLVFTGVPAFVTYRLFKLVERKLPNHFFIYVLVNGFFVVALSVITIGLTATALMALSGVYKLDYLLEQYTPYYVLLAWSEAFSTGMAVTLMAVYRPEWLETFDDNRYIKNK
ncbi:MAG: energy-coupling factor ABC transporter permease [Thiobacillaceae bacterium]